jgi:hypothetical protein
VVWNLDQVGAYLAVFGVDLPLTVGQVHSN